MLDFTTILALVVAIVVFMQLRNVLGKRTGNERPPFDPSVRRGQGMPAEAREGSEATLERDDDDRVVTLPSREEDKPYREIDKVAPRSSALNRGLRQVRDADPDFAPRQFLDGARAAYEMIVGAFAEGDRQTLRQLLAPEVYEDFDAAIGQREAAGHSVRHSFVGIEEAAIETAAVRDGEAFVAVRIVSQLIQATFDGDGDLVDGDPEAVSEVRDMWTFARDVGSDDPNWKLVATEAEDADGDGTDDGAVPESEGDTGDDTRTADDRTPDADPDVPTSGDVPSGDVPGTDAGKGGPRASDDPFDPGAR